MVFLAMKKDLRVKQVVVVVIHQVRDQLVAKAIQGRHDVNEQLPLVAQTSYEAAQRHERGGERKGEEGECV